MHTGLNSMWTFLGRFGNNAIAALASMGALQVVAFFTICLVFLVSFVPLQQNADGILLSVMSIQKLTIYYWGQDRYGNITPLLTAWIRNPIWNVCAQLFLRLLTGLIAPVFYCSLAFRNPANIWRAALVVDGLLLIAGSPIMLREIYAEANPSGTSLALVGLAAMALRTPPARVSGMLWHISAAAAVVIAYIVDLGLVIIALPAVGLLALINPSVGNIRLAAVHLLAAAIGYLVPDAITVASHTPMGFTPLLGNIVRYAVVIWV